LVAAAAIAIAATGLEQLSGFGFDNLSVPLATAYLWQLAMP
jgi:dolichol kinase